MLSLMVGLGHRFVLRNLLVFLEFDVKRSNTTSAPTVACCFVGMGACASNIRSGRLTGRQRFTVFAFFAHTLFPDYCEFLPAHHGSPKAVQDPERKFEYLCDVAAAEMLLPAEDFLGDIRGLQWLGFETIHTLRQRYAASIDATVYRLIELADHIQCAAVFLTDQRAGSEGGGPLWVKNASRNSLFKSFIPAGTSIPTFSVAVECLRNGVETSNPVKETWWVAGNPRTWLVQATKLPVIPENPEYPKVVALLFPTGYAKNWVARTTTS